MKQYGCRAISEKIGDLLQTFPTDRAIMASQNTLAIRGLELAYDILNNLDVVWDLLNNKEMLDITTAVKKYGVGDTAIYYRVSKSE